MTARATYEAVVAPSSVPGSASNVRAATNIANANNHQETLAANGSTGLGTSRARGVSASQDVTIRAANTTYQLAKQTAAMTEQVTIDNARAVLRNAGDVGPV